MRELFQDRCLPNPALAMDYEYMVDKFSSQVVFNPLEYIFPAKEHTGFNDWRSGNIWIENPAHSFSMKLEQTDDHI
jgi:hypothetical protein